MAGGQERRAGSASAAGGILCLLVVALLPSPAAADDAASVTAFKDEAKDRAVAGLAPLRNVLLLLETALGLRRW